MAIFDKFQSLVAARQELAEIGIDPFHVEMERTLSATEAVINGQYTILAGTNNYLGMTFDPACQEAAIQAIRTEGTGTTGSRMANGSYSSHQALERELADFYGWRDAIVFSTGYLANLGVISTLAGPQEIVLLDGDSHASLYDSCRLGGAETIRFRHNDMADLEKRLRRLGERTAHTLIVVEGIYSMLGDTAPLAELARLKEKYHTYLLVDEAHSLGVLGKQGRGLVEQEGVQEAVDFIIGTFSKSLGTIGGFCVSDRPELDLLRYTSRPYIFTASPPPSVVASARAALRTLRHEQQGRELRTRLWRNAAQLYEGLSRLGYSLGPQSGPVIAVILGDKKQALLFWQQLLACGVYVNLILPPATPGSDALLRCSISAAHTPVQIEHIIAAFAALQKTTDHYALQEYWLADSPAGIRPT